MFYYVFMIFFNVLKDFLMIFKGFKGVDWVGFVDG